MSAFYLWSENVSKIDLLTIRSRARISRRPFGFVRIGLEDNSIPRKSLISCRSLCWRFPSIGQREPSMRLLRLAAPRGAVSSRCWRATSEPKAKNLRRSKGATDTRMQRLTPLGAVSPSTNRAGRPLDGSRLLTRLSAVCKSAVDL